MSWSISYNGGLNNASAEIEAQFAALPECPEPEESIKQSARALILSTVAGQSIKPGETLLLSISAWGSQSARYDQPSVPGEPLIPSGHTNSLTVTITAQHG